ncbi:MAG: O-antigen ligase family protein, partial [Bdellovibrionales bacterium]|nr:O-antigen ligase family protein [Bdellovibrionales bacterium]
MLGPCLSLLTSLSLVLGGVLQFLSLDSAGQVASCLGVGCLLFGVCLPKRFAVTREKVLALLAPWFAVFGLGSTFVLLVAYLLLSFRWTRLSELYGWALPLWAVLVAWQLGWWSVQAEWGMISELASKTDASACLMSALRSRSLPVVSQFYDFCRMLLLMCFIGYFVNFETRRDEVLRWIPWGFGGAVFLSLVQVFSPLGTYFPAQTDFWSGLSRFVGAFEDPNAFGVASFLSVPLLLVSRSQRSKTVHLDVLIAALCLVALYSGSRTFLLGLILFLILSACALFRNGRPPFRALFVMGLLVVGVPLILMFVLDSQSLPNSLVRVKELLVSGDIATALFSRMVFARIGLHEWFDYPLFGIGWGRFGSFVTPYSEYLGLGIGSWSDNANNFYLGILAELGIVGGVALVVSLLFLTPRLAEPCSVNARRGVLCFAVLLMVGPHFLNDSVLFLFSLLVSIGYTTRVLSGMWKHLTLQLLPFFAVLSVLNFQYS